MGRWHGTVEGDDHSENKVKLLKAREGTVMLDTHISDMYVDVNTIYVVIVLSSAMKGATNHPSRENAN